MAVLRLSHLCAVKKLIKRHNVAYETTSKSGQFLELQKLGDEGNTLWRWDLNGGPMEINTETDVLISALGKDSHNNEFTLTFKMNDEVYTSQIGSSFGNGFEFKSTIDYYGQTSSSYLTMPWQKISPLSEVVEHRGYDPIRPPTGEAAGSPIVIQDAGSNQTETNTFAAMSGIASDETMSDQSITGDPMMDQMFAASAPNYCSLCDEAGESGFVPCHTLINGKTVNDIRTQLLIQLQNKTISDKDKQALISKVRSVLGNTLKIETAGELRYNGVVMPLKLQATIDLLSKTKDYTALRIVGYYSNKPMVELTKNGLSTPNFRDAAIKELFHLWKCNSTGVSPSFSNFLTGTFTVDTVIRRLTEDQTLINFVKAGQDTEAALRSIFNSEKSRTGFDSFIYALKYMLSDVGTNSISMKAALESLYGNDPMSNVLSFIFSQGNGEIVIGGLIARIVNGQLTLEVLVGDEQFSVSYMAGTDNPLLEWKHAGKPMINGLYDASKNEAYLEVPALQYVDDEFELGAAPLLHWNIDTDTLNATLLYGSWTTTNSGITTTISGDVKLEDKTFKYEFSMVAKDATSRPKWEAKAIANAQTNDKHTIETFEEETSLRAEVAKSGGNTIEGVLTQSFVVDAVKREWDFRANGNLLFTHTNKLFTLSGDTLVTLQATNSRSLDLNRVNLTGGKQVPLFVYSEANATVGLLNTKTAQKIYNQNLLGNEWRPSRTVPTVLLGAGVDSDFSGDYYGLGVFLSLKVPIGSQPQ